ncbi:hypothetical protein P7K49_023787 [Saguinus oedipus]|uniref:PRA1 family protein n=1 Tax=Saguinus oedipus TaxID=9490 RepID=A0ABQ9UMP5_SAGOE|nr:hypothetical protein P7K49_023787 [Saguinus oedipus]
MQRGVLPEQLCVHVPGNYPVLRGDIPYVAGGSGFLFRRLLHSLSAHLAVQACALWPRAHGTAHQYALAGGISFPFFWLAGAGWAVFWVLGATLVVIGSHAAFHQIKAMEGEELQMELV